MNLRLGILALGIAFALIFTSMISSTHQGLALELNRKNARIADKTQGQEFTVQIPLKNTGATAGSWSIDIAFEGERWTWTGIAQNLTLNAGESETLKWIGNVPEDAPIGSTSRLVVYYDDAFLAVDSWIHVISEARLTITGSSVE